MQLAEAYQICEAIIREHSKTFYQACSFLPGNARPAVCAIYAFCRRADDIVDELQDAALLAEFEADTRRHLVDRQPSREPLWMALLDVFSHHEMQARPFFDMIEGQKMDLHKTRYRTLEELLPYCYHVASTVGLMVTPVLAPKAVRQLEPAVIRLGQAMQLTNILRDVGEDCLKDRIYLPQEILERHGYSAAQLQRGELNDGFRNAWEEVAQAAERLYAEALPGLHYYPMRARFAVEAAARLYRGILNTVRKNGYQVFTRKQFVSDEDKRDILSGVEAQRPA